jgi:hypothetical protein
VLNIEDQAIAALAFLRAHGRNNASIAQTNRVRAGPAFLETGGHSRSPEDTKAASFEFRRAVTDPGGHARTQH